MRQKLLTQLRALNVQTVYCQYDGYGDSGQVNDINLNPLPASVPKELDDDLEEFFWSTVQSVQGGFHNNEGGQGEFNWNIETDELELNHQNNYIMTDDMDYKF